MSEENLVDVEIETRPLEESLVPEPIKEVAVAPKAQGIVMPNPTMIGQTAVNTAVTMACGVVITTAFQALGGLAKKAFTAGTTKISGLLEERNEKKELKKLEAQIQKELEAEDSEE